MQNALNIYQINIREVLLFMYKVNNKCIRSVFNQNQAFPISNNKYKTRSTKIQFPKLFFRIKSIQYHAVANISGIL